MSIKTRLRNRRKANDWLRRFEFKTSAEAKKATTKYVDFLDSIEPMERWRA